MTQLATGSAAHLIDLSEREDRIVYTESSVGVDAQLHDDCDGEAHSTGEINGRMAEIHEYWGDTWRVHTVQYLETLATSAQ